MSTTRSLLLKEIEVQLTKFTSGGQQNLIWQDFFNKYKFRSQRDEEDVLVYLTNTRIHKELMEKYFPFQNVTEIHKVESAAKRVGLALPLGISGEEEQK